MKNLLMVSNTFKLLFVWGFKGGNHCSHRLHIQIYIIFLRSHHFVPNAFDIMKQVFSNSVHTILLPGISTSFTLRLSTLQFIVIIKTQTSSWWVVTEGEIKDYKMDYKKNKHFLIVAIVWASVWHALSWRRTISNLSILCHCFWIDWANLEFVSQ